MLVAHQYNNTYKINFNQTDKTEYLELIKQQLNSNNPYSEFSTITQVYHCQLPQIKPYIKAMKEKISQLTNGKFRLLIAVVKNFDDNSTDNSKRNYHIHAVVLSDMKFHNNQLEKSNLTKYLHINSRNIKVTSIRNKQYYIDKAKSEDTFVIDHNLFIDYIFNHHMVFQTSLIDKLQTKPLKSNNELDISKDIWNQYHGIVNSAVNQLKPIERIKFNDAKKYAIDKIYGYRTKLELLNDIISSVDVIQKIPTPIINVVPKDLKQITITKSIIQIMGDVIVSIFYLYIFINLKYQLIHLNSPPNINSPP